MSEEKLTRSVYEMYSVTSSLGLQSLSSLLILSIFSSTIFVC